MAAEERLREHILELLRGGQAHATFDDVVADFPPELRGVRPNALPYSAWKLVEHIRIAQRDILDYSRAARDAYAAPAWPAGYWPAADAPPTATAWDESIATIRAEREEMEQMVADPLRDLFATLPASSEGHSLLREALLVADHTAYHVGELVLLRRMLGSWD